MPASKSCDLPSGAPSPVVKEEHIEYGFIGKLQKLTDAEFARLLDEVVTPDVFTAAKTLRGINAFTRDDGTPLNYTLVTAPAS